MNSSGMKDILAVAGALATLLATVPYLVDIIKKKTKPNIVSWITWTVLTGIGTVAAFAAGEWRTAIQTMAVMVWTLSVVLLGLRYGIAKFTRFDTFCQAGAVVGLVLWFVFNSPAIAIVAAVTIDMIGALPTLRHSWLEPDEETWQTFALAVFGPVFTIVSVSAYSIESLLYPGYFVLINGAIAAIVVYRRQQMGISLGRHGAHETLHE
jgi:hypothetical protein